MHIVNIDETPLPSRVSRNRTKKQKSGNSNESSTSTLQLLEANDKVGASCPSTQVIPEVCCLYPQIVMAMEVNVRELIDEAKENNSMQPINMSIDDLQHYKQNGGDLGAIKWYNYQNVDAGFEQYHDLSKVPIVKENSREHFYFGSAPEVKFLWF